MLLDGKKLVITGVLTKDSIAAGVARRAQEQGAEVLLTSFGRGMRLTERVARTLPLPADVVELDVTNTEHHRALATELANRWGKVDGALHAVGFAPETCLGQDSGLMAADWDDVATALHVSAYSLKTLAQTVAPLMPEGGSVVGLDFDARQVWPAYDWMGVAKAALEATARYLARDLGPQGVRVNLVSAGPLRTLAARSIPGFAAMEDAWARRAPLGWDVRDSDAVSKACVALLSDWFPATTGEIIHVDGGAHAIALSVDEGPAQAATAATAGAGAAEAGGAQAEGTDAPKRPADVGAIADGAAAGAGITGVDAGQP
ncbi:MAG TPA: enoyl-ACP reductase FabI [Acidimicrobiales bacterium]|nr:enoyl-ACP reductase FabI [Acidimicrobiales bacterium]